MRPEDLLLEPQEIGAIVARPQPRGRITRGEDIAHEAAKKAVRVLAKVGLLNHAPFPPGPHDRLHTDTCDVCALVKWAKEA